MPLAVDAGDFGIVEDFEGVSGGLVILEVKGLSCSSSDLLARVYLVKLCPLAAAAHYPTRSTAESRVRVGRTHRTI